MKFLKEFWGFEPCFKTGAYLLIIPTMIMMYWTDSKSVTILGNVGMLLVVYLSLKAYQTICIKTLRRYPIHPSLGIHMQNRLKKLYLTMKPVHWLERIIFYEKKDTLALRAEKITLGYFFSHRFQWFMRVPYLIGFYVITLSIRDVFFLGYPWGLYLFAAVTITVFMILRCIEIELMKTIGFEN